MIRLDHALATFLALACTCIAPCEGIPGQTVVRLSPSAYAQYRQQPRAYLGFKVLKRVDALRSVLLATPTLISPAQFRSEPGVVSAEQNQVVRSAFTPDDPLFNSQWYLGKTNVPIGWELGRGSTATPVAIVDTGIQYTHPDLADMYMPGGYDFVNADNDPLDDFGHGTLVSGIVSATTNNATGVAGIGYGCPLIGIKVLNAGGGGSTFDVAQGIAFAVTDTPARVINISLGTNSADANLEAACQLAADNGVVVIAAAGNNNSSNPFYPAYYNTCVAVGASDQNDLKLDISNFSSDWVHVAAPGKEMMSTNLGSGYGGISGTSMAAPVVTGLAALLYERLGPGRSLLKAGLVRSWITAGCADVAPWTMFGRVDALDSMRFARGVSPLSFSWAPYFTSEDTTFPMASDSLGNVYVAYSQGSSGNSWIVVEKHSAHGSLVWKRIPDRFGLEDTPKKIVVDSQGRVFVVGYTQKSGGTTDAIFFSYNAGGGLVWRKSIDSVSHRNDKAQSVAESGDKVFAVGSYTQDPVQMENATVWVLRKTDGVLMSSKQYNGLGSGADSANDIAIRPDGRAYIVATAWTGTDNNGYVFLYNQANNDLHLLAGYNSVGNGDDRMQAVNVHVAANGDAIVAGTSYRLAGDQAFVARVRSTGGFVWAKVFPNYMSSICQDTVGNIFWCGTEIRNPSQSALLAYKLDPQTGGTVWSRKFFGFGDVMAGLYRNSGSSCVISGGSLIVCGSTDGPSQHDCTSLWLNSSTGKLLRFARYDAGGAEEVAGNISISSTTKDVYSGLITNQAVGQQARVVRYAP